ncbi:Mpo1-like protein [Rufibacter sp. XAAS-G3-1]|uniref:Mpo1-like protein n=1 Tax=Rufibacter sp. XAAS-G3-1 TaxID=2729134 RepID=UPI0021073073|nr:Mpo1-like protein [Rufibacter sp. XAAS-G3-1]
MAAIQHLLDVYAESHRNGTHKLIHLLCVPAIMTSLVSLIWAIQVPEFFQNLLFVFNWGILFVLLRMAYSVALSRLALGMILVT